MEYWWRYARRRNDCLNLDLGDLKIVRKSGKCNLQSAIRNLQSAI